MPDLWGPVDGGALSDLDPVAVFVRARVAEMSPRDELATREHLEGIHAILDEFEARDQDATLMLGPGCKRQWEWAGLRLAVRLFAAEHSTHPDYRQEWKT